uniref:Uncharacterized protein n=1 Tax=Meloidogyne incognita TaxID=6306 RepID=A0A914P338_MELIC
ENIPVKNVSAGDPGPSCSATKKFAFELLIAVTGLENISVSKTGKVISIVDLGTNVDLGTYDLPSFVDTKTIGPYMKLGWESFFFTTFFFTFFLP